MSHVVAESVWGKYRVQIFQTSKSSPGFVGVHYDNAISHNTSIRAFQFSAFDKALLMQLRHPKLNWHCISTWISLLHSTLHSPSVEQAVSHLSSKIVISRLLDAETTLAKQQWKGKEKKKEGKLNPVTRIIWQDDSSLVKGIGTAVLAGSPPNVIAYASSQSLLFSVTLSQVIVKAEHLSAPAEQAAPPCQ